MGRYFGIFDVLALIRCQYLFPAYIVTSGFSENTTSENQCRGTIPLFIL
jgi:hypothetical protein